jgi:hypothetical protein
MSAALRVDITPPPPGPPRNERVPMHWSSCLPGRHPVHPTPLDRGAGTARPCVARGARRRADTAGPSRCPGECVPVHLSGASQPSSHRSHASLSVLHFATQGSCCHTWRGAGWSAVYLVAVHLSVLCLRTQELVPYLVRHQLMRRPKGAVAGETRLGDDTDDSAEAVIRDGKDHAGCALLRASNHRGGAASGGNDAGLCTRAGGWRSSSGSRVGRVGLLVMLS